MSNKRRARECAASGASVSEASVSEASVSEGRWEGNKACVSKRTASEGMSDSRLVNSLSSLGLMFARLSALDSLANERLALVKEYCARWG